MYLAIFFILLAYLYVSFKTVDFLNLAHFLSEDQIRLNKQLTWLIPFLWPAVVRSFLKPPMKGSADPEIQKMRENDKYSWPEAIDSLGVG